MRASLAGGWKLSQIFAVGVLLLLPGLLALAPGVTSERGTTATGATNIGDGLYTLTSVQQVNATPYWDNFNCPSQAQFRWCVDAVGLTYVSPANLVVFTEGACGYGCGGARNSVVQYYAANGTYGTPLGLNCFPGVPYFPGVGEDLFIPCSNYNQSWSSVIEVNYQTNTVVANISGAAGATVLAYDSVTGMVIGGGGTTLVVINPATGVVASRFQVPNATFLPANGFGSNTLVYDPATNSLIVPSTTNKLFSVDPTSGKVESSIPLPAAGESLAIDPAANLLFATTVNISGQKPTYAGIGSVFSAGTFAREAQFSIAPCVNNICAGSDVDQILPDPAHGDAYFVGTTALYALNLSTLTLVGATEDYGDGWVESATYVPTTGQILLTYAPPIMTGPGLMLQLHHRTITVLTSFLWLPPIYGALTLLLLVVAVILVVVYVQVRAWQSRRKRLMPDPTS
jgi:hypothetical protein